MKPFNTKERFSIPNLMGYFRLLLIPVFCYLYLAKEAYHWAAGVVLLSSLTDLFDGKIARKYNMVTNFGKFMDPLADKCLVMAALCWFVENGDMVGWVLAVVLLREFAVSGMRLVAVEKGRVIAAAWSGKVKTASTMVCICLMLFGIPHWLNLVCQAVILVTTVYSGVEYFVKNWDVFRDS